MKTRITACRKIYHRHLHRIITCINQSCTVFYMPNSHKLAGAGVKYEKGRGQQAVLALKKSLFVFFFFFFFLKNACIEKTKRRLADRWRYADMHPMGRRPCLLCSPGRFRRNCANIKFHNHRLFD